MGRVERIRERVQGRLRARADILYRDSTTWSDGTTCQFSVLDPSRADGTLARSLRQRPDAPDMRVLEIHPDHPRPAPGSHIPWEHGVLFIERYAQESAFTATAPGVCRFVDPARTRHDLLTFATSGPLVEDPRTGNVSPSPGVPLTLPARLEATTDPQARDAVGADTATVVLFGRWGKAGEPQPWPDGVRWGSTCPLTLQGQPGTLTVRLAWPDADPVQSLIHGEPFLATWRST
ncbi:hypothetical protein Dcar01_02386 [Deinococcus carri]|uniref:Uncharacterized protein n=1 Tax=Deinococcus carri TaxID=1211323 RepID=A0ABP9W8G5_9DEIO